MAGVTKEDLMVLVDQKKKNPVEETKGKLPIFEGSESKDKDACLNLEAWIGILESLTVGEVWDDSGRINLVVERLWGGTAPDLEDLEGRKYKG